MTANFDVFAPDHGCEGIWIGAEVNFSDAVELIRKHGHRYSSGRFLVYSQQTGDRTYFNVETIDGVLHVSGAE
jgi:hypothetical protein